MENISSLFRSYNVSNFSLSSVECFQIQNEIDEITIVDDLNSNQTDCDKTSRTVLLLSAWDNTTYFYDMNYNRCFYSMKNLHEDAVSRVRLFNTKSINSMYVLTSSWDSYIKLNHLTLKNSKKFSSSDFLANEFIRIKCLNELAHDSSVN